MRFVRLVLIGVVLGLIASASIHIFQPWFSRNETAQVKISVSPTPVPTLAPSPSNPPRVAGQANIKISMYGVNVTVTDPITDLVYGEIKYGGSIVAGFTTQTLLAKYPACTAGALGVLTRSNALTTAQPSKSPSSSSNSYSTSNPLNQPFRKTIGGFTYSYKNPLFSCANDQSGRDSVAADRVAIQNSALPSLTN